MVGNLQKESWLAPTLTTMRTRTVEWYWGQIWRNQTKPTNHSHDTTILPTNHSHDTTILPTTRMTQPSYHMYSYSETSYGAHTLLENLTDNAMWRNFRPFSLCLTKIYLTWIWRHQSYTAKSAKTFLTVYILLPFSATITRCRYHSYIGTTIVTWQDYGYAHKHALLARYFNGITADDHWLLSVRFHYLS